MNVNKKKRAGWVLALLLAAASAPAAAVDGIATELGRADGNDMARVAIQWDWAKRWFQTQSWHLGGYWDLGLGHWRRGSVRPGQNDAITEIGVTPVLRFQPNDLRGPYLEAGIGFHLLSETSLGDKRFSTMIQFGDHAGLGYRFGD